MHFALLLVSYKNLRLLMKWKQLNSSNNRFCTGTAVSFYLLPFSFQCFILLPVHVKSEWTKNKQVTKTNLQTSRCIQRTILYNLVTAALHTDFSHIFLFFTRKVKRYPPVQVQFGAFSRADLYGTTQLIQSVTPCTKCKNTKIIFLAPSVALN